MWRKSTGILTGVFLCVAGIVLLAAGTREGTDDRADTEKTPKVAVTKEAVWATAVEPKSLSKNVQRGLAWLAQHQLESGGWGQGDESANMGGGKMKDVPSVADTCTAALALLRSGSTPEKGEYARNILAAVRFVCAEVEASDTDSLYITKTRNTRVQSKLGPYIDTFMASLLLAEVQEKIADKKELQRVTAAIEKVMGKIQKNQRKDGTWDGRGWAPALSQSMAVKGLNRYAQTGGDVDEEVRARAEKYSREQYDRKSGAFAPAGSAGVKLYASAASLSAQSDSTNTNKQKKDAVREKVKTATTQAAREEAQSTLDRYDAAEKDLKAAREAVVKKLEDKQFIAGFGSNGGEEFLSYMNIGEGLVVDGGEAWVKWDEAISKNMNRIQNADGSWTGHHCITGRTFCTSSALLVMMVDRTPFPTAAKIARR